MEKNSKRLGYLMAVAIAAPASAQTATNDTESDIVVTARKRDETLISVPVVVSAIGGAEIERRAINKIDILARSIPQLMIGEATGSPGGGNIAIRGIAGAEANAFADQAVSFNVDGVQIARATVRRMAEMDLAQVEVLKGPQALFFGKNSPGGIISIRTADPTSTLQGKIQAGYETRAHEITANGFISGPLTDTLGFRVAGYYSDMRGWIKNLTPPTALLAPKHEYAPNYHEYAIRGTLKFEPSDRFNARAKLTYSKRDGSSIAADAQLLYCPLGTAQTALPVPDSCRLDGTNVMGANGPNFVSRDSRLEQYTYLKTDQLLGSLEMNYDLTDDVTLTSVTGYYRTHTLSLENHTYTSGPATALPSYNDILIREISEEVRLASDFEGPINFMVGGHYQNTSAKNETVTGLNALTPVTANNYYISQKGKAWSVFGQLMWKIVPTVELSAGGRYSDEKKHLPDLLAVTPPAFGPATVSVKTPFRSGKWNNFSPEATLSWRPSEDLTVFGSYKKGFLSGGFNANAITFTNPIRYNQQLVKGFEGGVKMALADRTLYINLAAYHYKVSGLQVTTYPAPTVQVIENAGKVTSKGFEADFTYRTPLEGLKLRGAVGYTKAIYNVYSAGCYRGQTQALGCKFGVPSGLPGAEIYSAQNLAGAPLVRAPKWSANGGFDFDRDISSALKIGLSGGVSYTSRYVTNTLFPAAAFQKPYTLFDATVRLTDTDDTWEAAIIGRNLTNKYYYTRASEVSFTGTAPGGTAPGRFADLAGVASRPREILFRLTYNFR